MAEDHQAMVGGWAQLQYWRAIHGVVVVGLTEAEPWKILREFRSDLLIICFEPDAKLARRMSRKLPDERADRKSVV